MLLRLAVVCEWQRLPAVVGRAYPSPRPDARYIVGDFRTVISAPLSAPSWSMDCRNALTVSCMLGRAHRGKSMLGLWLGDRDGHAEKPNGSTSIKY